MNRPNFGWNHVAEFLGIIGVIGSLIFVAFEVRQNTNAIKGSTIQAIAELSYDSTMAMVENADLRAASHASVSGSLTQDQISQLDAWYAGMMRIQQNRLLQSELGILEIDDAIAAGGRSPVYRSPYFEVYWSRAKSTFSPEFQQYIEKYVLGRADE